MREGLHQLRLRRLVRIVTLNAVRCAEGLFAVRLDERCVFRIVAVDTERWHGLGQVLIELDLADLSHFVGDVASVAPHVESGMTTALLRNIKPLIVASEAEVVLLLARGRLEQLELIVGLVRIVALDAIAHGRRVDRSFEGSGVLVSVTGDAKRLRSRGDELYAGDVFVDPHLVTAHAAHRDRGVDSFSLGLVFVTLNAFGCVRLRVERDRVNCAEKICPAKQGQAEKKQDFQQHVLQGRSWDDDGRGGEVPRLTYELGERSHGILQSGVLHEGRRFDLQRGNFQQRSKCLDQNNYRCLTTLCPQLRMTYELFRMGFLPHRNR